MCKSGFIIIVCNLLTNLLLNLIVLILYKFKFIISLWKINIYINNSTNVQKQPQSLKSLPSSWEPPPPHSNFKPRRATFPSPSPPPPCRENDSAARRQNQKRQRLLLLQLSKRRRRRSRNVLG